MKVRYEREIMKFLLKQTVFLYGIDYTATRYATHYGDFINK